METLPIIQDLVTRTNQIVTHVCQFLKLNFLSLYGKGQSFPTVNTFKKNETSFLTIAWQMESFTTGELAHIKKRYITKGINLLNDRIESIMARYPRSYEKIKNTNGRRVILLDGKIYFHFNSIRFLWSPTHIPEYEDKMSLEPDNDEVHGIIYLVRPPVEPERAEDGWVLDSSVFSYAQMIGEVVRYVEKTKSGYKPDTQSSDKY
jgi:hypothetical protein